MPATDVQRKANRRLGLMLALLAALFGLGYVAKVVWFGA
jgi:hypothetical protein